MTRQHTKMVLTAIALGLMASSVSVAAEAPIYGSQLMTRQERIEHRNKLRAAKSVEEREQVRLQHHEQMQLRAKEKGVTLPDAPPAIGGGQGRRLGPADGMGGMGGMGPGMGLGRNR